MGGGGKEKGTKGGPSQDAQHDCFLCHKDDAPSKCSQCKRAWYVLLNYMLHSAYPSILVPGYTMYYRQQLLYHMPNYTAGS